MEALLPQAYLFGIIGLLAIVSLLVGRQLLRVRNDEINLIKLEKGNTTNSKKASELYELASVQLRKRLYPQAVTTLKKALSHLKEEPEEAKALIENALGFALAAQDNFKTAIGHYRTAIKAKPDYPVALNNLAYASQKLDQKDEAIMLYKQVLEMDPKNKTAIKQLKLIQKKENSSVSNNSDTKGF